MAEQECPVTNLLLLGRSENGKSSTGNTIIGEKYFEVNLFGRDMDQRCKMFRALIEDGPIINVIDTPGIYSIKTSYKVLVLTLYTPNWHLKSFGNCLSKNSPITAVIGG